MTALVLQSDIRDGQFNDQSWCPIRHSRLVDAHLLSDMCLSESVQHPFLSGLATSHARVNRFDRSYFDPLASVGHEMGFVIVHTGDSSR